MPAFIELLLRNSLVYTKYVISKYDMNAITFVVRKIYFVKMVEIFDKFNHKHSIFPVSLS